MDDASSCIFGIIFFAIIFIGWPLYEKKGKENVKNDLESKGYQEIEITRTWAFGRREMTYDVKYLNRQGKIIANSCIVAAGFFSPGDVYWKDPI